MALGSAGRETELPGPALGSAPGALGLWDPVPGAGVQKGPSCVQEAEFGLAQRDEDAGTGWG